MDIAIASIDQSMECICFLVKTFGHRFSLVFVPGLNIPFVYILYSATGKHVIAIYTTGQETQ